MKRKLKLTIRTIAILYLLLNIISTIPAPLLAETGDYTLAANETVVYDFAGLKTALTSSTNGITTVYFGANITMGSGGITIDSSKTNVIISGINPLDPNQTTPYTLTDYSSSSQSNSIYIYNSGVKSILITDLNIVGKNYYGPVSANESYSADSLVMTYQRVSYSGPQIGYNRKGLIRFIDCYVNINGSNGGSENQEFSEAKYLKFEGANTIDFLTVTWGVFWHTNVSSSSHGTFEVADDSSLTVTANSRSTTSTAYGVFAALGGYVDITIGANAVFNIETSGSMNGLSSGSAAYFPSFTVKNGGAFNLKTTKAATIAVMQINGGLFIEDNASFKINGYGGASYALLIQRDGNITVSKDAVFHLTTGGTYIALLRQYGTSLLCYDPASVLLYNVGGRTIDSVTTAGKLHIEAEQINYWTTAGSGGFADSPLYRCKKADGSNFVIDGTIATGTSGNFSTFITNYTAGDSPSTAPTASTFGIVSARVLSFGRLSLIMHEVNEQSTAISGTTSPGAAVRVYYIVNITGKYLPDVVADENGFYTIPLDTLLPEDAAVYVWSNYRFLTAAASTWVKPVGEVEMTVPDSISFNSTGLAPSVQMAGRSDTAWGITIIDTRGTGSGWRIYARAPVPLTFLNSSGTVLNGALVFVDDTGAVTPLDTTQPLLIEQHTAASDSDIKVIHWAANRGIMARIPPDAVLAGKYTGSIEWILADTP